MLAQREGERDQTGLNSATRGGEARRIAGLAEAVAPAFDVDLAQEFRLAALTGLSERPVDRGQMLMLGGSMQPYVWTINGAVSVNISLLRRVAASASCYRFTTCR